MVSGGVLTFRGKGSVGICWNLWKFLDHRIYNHWGIGKYLGSINTEILLTCWCNSWPQEQPFKGVEQANWQSGCGLQWQPDTCIFWSQAAFVPRSSLCGCSFDQLFCFLQPMDFNASTRPLGLPVELQSTPPPAIPKMAGENRRFGDSF